MAFVLVLEHGDEKKGVTPEGMLNHGGLEDVD